MRRLPLWCRGAFWRGFFAGLPTGFARAYQGQALPTKSEILWAAFRKTQETVPDLTWEEFVAIAAAYDPLLDRFQPK